MSYKKATRLQNAHPLQQNTSMLQIEEESYTKTSSCSCLKKQSKKIFTLLLLAYLAFDLTFYEYESNGSTILLSNITTIVSKEQIQLLQFAFGIISAITRCVAIAVVLNLVHRLITFFVDPAQENKDTHQHVQRFHNVAATKGIELTTMTSSQAKGRGQSARIKNSSVGKGGGGKSKGKGKGVVVAATGGAPKIQYQPPAVRIHNVELEVSMQDDFSHAMQVRQRQTFGIDRDMAYKHKPTKGFQLPRAKRSPSSALGKSRDKNASIKPLTSGAKAEHPTSRLQCIHVSDAVSHPHSKSSFFIPASVVEDELEILRQEIGELRSLVAYAANIEQNVTGNISSESKINMKTGKNFRTYDTAKGGKKHGRHDSSSNLVKKRSASLMFEQDNFVKK